MKDVFYEDFSKVLLEYKTPVSREEKLIKHKLESVVSLYDNCSLEEREFADEIMLECARIIMLLNNKHKKEVLALERRYDALKEQFGVTEDFLCRDLQLEQESEYQYDREVLEAFYDHCKGDFSLSYWEIDSHKFASAEERKKNVNLTIWDYCNRIKTFAYKYLYEIFPEDSIHGVIHGDEADDFESYENVVFVYNNIDTILKKFKTTDENGNSVKQRLNIRSALRKLKELKRECE